MKINLNDLAEMDSFSFVIKGVEINLNIEDEVLDITVNLPLEIVNKDLNERTKTWFNTILTKADEYDKKKKVKKESIEKSYIEINCHNSSDGSINMLNKLRNNDDLKSYIKSLSQYGEKTNKERSEIMFGINPLSTSTEYLEKEEDENE